MKRGVGLPPPPVKSLGEKHKTYVFPFAILIYLTGGGGGEDDACLANLLEKALWRKRLETLLWAYFSTWLC